ncbi:MULTISPECIES: restriction endonuclease subunit S [Staphylococcus]|uniref:restriction endonuclease subunit S n=1 Tax=Staphylococcus TaxID=1279 RepID=UPI00187FD9D6|nr:MULTISPECIES: restriction endonuclease subunit S [unclassified Staphylococcus]MBF2756492.1 restriction endonuclease subunit S [Staphylococcus haemolyticus]MBF2773740.1 restriction endonuclease subunit S [Staphylococcus haemolyticus]MBF2775856.1 restriction endonuclease subunit S [Staphylococcus haemolyticus]MBF2815425.1 restriction endonuclease subunit S [Staphylococcus haemolyticus]MBF9719801.1 restriction endonuclease subunit S [Staphylococcus haemolyticus]
MTEQQNTPELRFPGFEENWVTSKLTLVTTLLKDGTHGTHKDVEIGPWLLSAKNIKNNKITIVENDRKISQTDFNKIYKNYNLRTDDLLLSIVGTIGNVALVKNPYNIAFQRSVAILRFKDCFSSLYFLYLFQTFVFKKKLKRNQVVSAQPGIYLGDLGKFEINIPESKKEQVKIGVFFSKLDRQIELEEQKLELLEQQKKGYMQKIFSQELRFKDKNGNEYPEWSIKKLKDIAEIIGGGTPSTKDDTYWDGNINWFSPVEIGDKDFVNESQKMITEKGLRKSSAKLLPIGTVLFTSRAGIGKTAILSKESTTNQGFQSIVPKENLLDSYFVYSMTSLLKRYAERVGAGSTFTEVSRKQMEEIKISTPTIKEQQKIGRLFYKNNRLIEKQKTKLKLLKQRKQGLLQKMFL